MKNYAVMGLMLCLLAISGCKKSNEDPKPVYHPVWTFVSMTMKHQGITATTSDCFKTELSNAGFSDDSWKYADQPVITFNTTSHNPFEATTVSYFNTCTSQTFTLDLKVIPSDSTTTIILTDPKAVYITQQLFVKNSDVSDSTKVMFNVGLFNTYDYIITSTFSKK